MQLWAAKGACPVHSGPCNKPSRPGTLWRIPHPNVTRRGGQEGAADPPPTIYTPRPSLPKRGRTTVLKNSWPPPGMGERVAVASCSSASARSHSPAGSTCSPLAPAWQAWPAQQREDQNLVDSRGARQAGRQAKMATLAVGQVQHSDRNQKATSERRKNRRRNALQRHTPLSCGCVPTAHRSSRCEGAAGTAACRPPPPLPWPSSHMPPCAAL